MKRFLLAFLVLFAPVASAVTLKNGKVEWTAVGNPGVVKITGQEGVLTGTIVVAGGLASGTFEVELAGFKTGIDLRDEHLKTKYLEVAKYPKAKLVMDPVATSTADFDWKGQLTLKGNTKPVKGKARVDGGKLWATFDVVLSDYPEIGLPTWLGITVAKEVTVVVNSDLTP